TQLDALGQLLLRLAVERLLKQLRGGVVLVALGEQLGQLEASVGVRLQVGESGNERLIERTSLLFGLLQRDRRQRNIRRRNEVRLLALRRLLRHLILELLPALLLDLVAGRLDLLLGECPRRPGSVIEHPRPQRRIRLLLLDLVRLSL